MTSRFHRALNWSLFRSAHGVLATMLVLGCVAALAWTGAVPGRGPGSDREYLVTTGWIALGLFAVVMAYVLRKHMHARGFSPEFWMRPRLGRDAAPMPRRRRMAARLEKAVRREEEAQLALRALGARVQSGELLEREEIEREAKRILKETGARRLFAVDVVAEGDGFALQPRPTEPFGRLADWLHVHLYYGLAALVVVGLHGGFVPRSLMAWLLLGGSAIVVVTGVWGIAMWTRGPTWLTEQERKLGITIEMAHALDLSLRLALPGALAQVEAVRADLERLLRLSDAEYEKRLPDFQGLLVAEPWKSAPRPLQDALVLIEQARRVRTCLRRLARVRAIFQGWRVVHVPLAWLFVGVIVLHVLSVWRY